MTQTYPGGSNTFVPSFESSGKLTIDFARDPSKFSVLKYAALVKVDKRTGLYLKMDWDESARTSVDGNEWAWVDGDAAPDNYLEKGFNWLPYTCKRVVFPFSLGQQAVDQADWDVIASYSQTAAAKAMTFRTARVLAALTDTAQMTQYGSAASLNVGGAFWSAGTVANPVIKQSLMTAANKITRATNGVVTFRDLTLLVNPTTAAALAQTQEIHQYMAGSPFSLPLLGENLVNFGLPSKLYGLNVEVAVDVRVTSGYKVARTDEFIVPDNTAIIVSRPGDIVQPMGTFSTVSIFSAEELTVETKFEQDNRRTVGRCVEDFCVQVTAPVSGYLITNLFS